MRDDAVAPVIAVMLILAAAVTFLVIFNGMVIPSLKESSETEHLHHVESAFQHFSSAIAQAVMARQGRMILSEPVQLGGGDVVLNTLRSGGSLAVMDEQEPVCYLTFYDGSGTEISGMNSTLVNISYNPAGNFWQEQGYRWQYGYLNVTKYGKRETPLSYFHMTDVNNDFSGAGSLAAFAGSFGSLGYTVNQTYFQNATPNPDNRLTFSPRPGNCSGIVLWAVNLSASPDRSFVSGNGFGKLDLKTRVTPMQYSGVYAVTFASEGKSFGNATFRKWNESFTTMTEDCENNIRYHPEHSGDDFSLYTIEHQQENPVNVTLNVVSVEVGAY